MHRATGFHWWIERFRRTFELVDLTRVDHFRGYVSYWAIPKRNRTARSGRWRRGPGGELFHAVERALGELPLIAEDLGHITPPVRALRAELGLPGIAVLLWGFGGRTHSSHRPENHRVDHVVYTSIHDTDTAAGWYASLKPAARAATGLDPAEPAWSLVELALSSRASLSVIPAQDVLGLGTEARMNRPGVTRGNWKWQLEARRADAGARGAAPRGDRAESPPRGLTASPHRLHPFAGPIPTAPAAQSRIVSADRVDAEPRSGVPGSAFTGPWRPSARAEEVAPR